MGIGQHQQALRKRRQPGVIGAGQGEREGKSQRAGATRAQVAQVDGQRFVSQCARVDRWEKVAPVHQHVARDGQLGSGGRLQQRTVIPHPKHGLADGPFEIAGDQVKLTHAGLPELWGPQ